MPGNHTGWQPLPVQRTPRMKPRLLDLFCGAGGAAMGYHRSGFEVIGVDIKPQPRYPFEFIQADALEWVVKYGYLFDAIHASPPCQRYSIMRNLPWNRHREYPDYIPATRDALVVLDQPYVIENVMGARLQAGYLCGLMFGLGCYNHRAFDTSFFWMQPGHPRHTLVFKRGPLFGANGGRRSLASEHFGIDWMTRDERSNALPPAYTEFIGKQLMAVMGVAA